MKKKTLITRRRFERITVRRNGLSGNLHVCAACGAPGDMLPVEEAGLIFRINMRTVFRLIETGEVHFAELPSGLLLICAASLQTALSRNDKP